MILPIDILKQILKGIDAEETTDPDGWWETADGANFGREKLAQTIEFVAMLSQQLDTAKKELDAISEKASAAIEEMRELCIKEVERDISIYRPLTNYQKQYNTAIRGTVNKMRNIEVRWQ